MQFLLEDSDGSYGSHGASKLAVRTIVAQALERNSRLLTWLAGPREATLLVRLEPELLKQLAVWQLFLRSPQHARAGEACDRLRQAQVPLEASVTALQEVQQVREALASGQSQTEAEAPLRLVAQRLQRLIDQNQPHRSLEQLLLIDSAALRDLAVDALEAGSQDELEAVLAANLLQDARTAKRCCQEALNAAAGAQQWLRARRWLQLHLQQMELFGGALSEEAQRRLWYRRRLLRVLERYAGAAVLLEELETARLTRHVTPREQQTLAAVLIELQTGFGPRAERLYRHAFPTRLETAVAVGAGQLPAANAEPLEDALEPAPRDIALR